MGDFESSYPVRSKSQVDSLLCDFEVKNTISLPSLAYACPLETSTSVDTSDDIPITPDLSLLLAPLGELKGGDRFEIDASSDDWCCIIVMSKDTFTKKHSIDVPSVTEFSDVTLRMELSDPIHMESFPSLGPTPPISSLFSLLPILLPSLDPLESTFVEFEIFVLGSPYLDQTLDDSDIERFEDHFEVKDLTLGHLMSFDV